jgi:hypothetical protein
MIRLITLCTLIILCTARRAGGRLVAKVRALPLDTVTAAHARREDS